MHEIQRYMMDAEVQLQSRYKSIQRLTRIDPGTAGDEGEENWASLLREWIPSTYRVVTKGRLLSPSGMTTKQYDVIILKPSYPPLLVNTKLYLMSGVAAAFECKTTLRPSHVKTAFARCKELKRLANEHTTPKSPLQELRISPVCGLLAHSHVWTNRPEFRMDIALRKSVEDLNHPREALDLICVSNLGSWRASLNITPKGFFGDEPLASKVALAYTHASPQYSDLTNPIGFALSSLYRRLAADDSTLRPIADYMEIARSPLPYGGMGRTWSAGHVLSQSTCAAIDTRAHHALENESWSEWALRHR